MLLNITESMVFKSSPSRPGEKKYAASRAPGNRWIWHLQSSPRRAPQSDLAMGARGAAGERARGNRMRETEQSCAREEIACQHLPPRVHLTGGDSEREREIERERERTAGRRYLESSPAALYSDLAVAALQSVARAPSSPINLLLLPLLQPIRVDSLNSRTQELLVLLRRAHLCLPVATPSWSCITGTQVHLPLLFPPSAQLLLFMVRVQGCASTYIWNWCSALLSMCALHVLCFCLC